MPVEIVREGDPPSGPPADVKLVTFNGEQFAVASKIGLMPLMKFAKFAKSGVDSADIEAMVAMYNLLQQCIADEPAYVHHGQVVTREFCTGLDPEEKEQLVIYGGWDAFEEHANNTRANDEDLMQVVSDVMEILTQRPTSRPSASSAGPQQTTPISEESSSALEVVRRLNSGEHPRPDLAMAVLRTQTG